MVQRHLCLIGIPAAREVHEVADTFAEGGFLLAGTNAATVSLQVVASPVIKTVQVVNRLLVLSGTNGPAGGNYRVLASPNPALPLTNWTTLATNQFSNGGGFNFTNALPWTNGSAFFLLSVP